MKRLWSSLSTQHISQATVKICALCGTLNQLENAECWTCRWHGEFSRDKHTISLAWQRLELLYEEVRLEHLTSQKARTLDEGGIPVPRSRVQLWFEKFLTWSRCVRTQCRVKIARRKASAPHGGSSRPNQLGV